MRRTVVRIDQLIELGKAEGGGVEERTLTDALVRIGGFRAQQQCRAVNGAARHDDVRRFGDQTAAAGLVIVVQGSDFHAQHFAAFHDQALGAGAVHQLRTLLQRRRNGGDQHGLFGVGGAAGAAVTQVPASGYVTRNDFPVDAERGGTTAQHRVIGVGRHLPRGNIQTLFHFFEPGRHLVLAHALHAELTGPVLQRRFRGAEAGGPVNHRGAAHAAALQDRHGAIFAHTPGAFLIQVAVGFAFVHAEVIAAFQRAFFQHQDLQTGIGENFRRGAATGTGADDDDIGFQHGAIGHTGGSAYVPAAADTVADRVFNAGHHRDVRLTG